MKFNKISLAILALSSILTGCKVGKAPDAFMPTNDTTPTQTSSKITKEIKEGGDISVLFEDDSVIGNGHDFEYAYNLPHNHDPMNDGLFHNGYFHYLAFEKTEDGNLKVMLGIDNTKYESNNISIDSNGFVKISFDNIGEIHPSVTIDNTECADNTSCGCGGPCPVSSEENSLTLGGKKTDLKYSDYGLWEIKTTTTFNDGYKETNTYVDPIIMNSYNGNINYGYIPFLDDKNIKFTGDTVAFETTRNYDENSQVISSSEKNLTGTIELDFDNTNNRTNLKLSYNDWKTLTGTIEGGLYFNSNYSNGQLRDNEGNHYSINLYAITSGNFENGSYDENTGEWKPTSVSNAEMVGAYDIETTPFKDSGTSIQIDGAFGAKTNDTIEAIWWCNTCK